MVHSKLKMKLFFLFYLLFIPFNFANAALIKVGDTCNVKDFYYDSSSHAVYAVTLDLGVLKSTNGGVTWVAKNTGITSSYAALYKLVGDGNGNIFLCAYAMFFRSSNGGDTWQQATAAGFPTDSGGDVKSMTFDSYTNKLFLISNSGGTFWSSNLGESWTLVNSANLNVYSIYSGKSDSSGITGMLLAGTYSSGIMKSTNGGDTWTSKGSTYWMTDIISGPNDWLFAISGDRIDRSKDYGESWTTVDSYPANSWEVYMAYDSESGYVYASTWSDHILRSINGGDSWESVSVPVQTNEYTRTVQCLPNQTLLVGTTSGIYRDGPAVGTNEPPAVPVLTSPGNGFTVPGSSIRLHWQKSIDPEGGKVTYRLQIAEDSGFTVNLQTFNVDENGNLIAGAAAALPFLALLGWRGRHRRKQTLVLLAAGMLLATTLVVGCGSGGWGNNAGTGDDKVSFEVTGLHAKTTYYWRVIAVDDQNKVSDPSETRSFTTH
jgi:hypothetical protein